MVRIWGYIPTPHTVTDSDERPAHGGGGEKHEKKIKIVINTNKNAIIINVLPWHLKACQSNMPSFLKLNTICMKNMHAYIDYLKSILSTNQASAQTEAASNS